jgi:zinc/manganese transport system permease protein
VTTFGVVVAAVALALGAGSLIRAVRAQGRSALASVAIVASAALALAGLLLLLFPHMDHHWLNWIEEAAPDVRLAFLDQDERDTYRDSYESVQRGAAEIRQLRVRQEEARWGKREMSEEMQERVRQYLAGRSEIVTGEQMALGHLRDKARERQRFWLGIPLLGIGAAGVLASARWRRKRAAAATAA